MNCQLVYELVNTTDTTIGLESTYDRDIANIEAIKAGSLSKQLQFKAV